MRKSEQEYHDIVFRYLNRKQRELNSLLDKLNAKNEAADGKDIIISNMKKVINKLEDDGKYLVKKMRQQKDSLADKLGD